VVGLTLGALFTRKEKEIEVLPDSD
jgi:hypothetical protein